MNEWAATIDLRPAVAADADELWTIRQRAVKSGCRGYYPAEVIEGWVSGPMLPTFAGLIENERFIVATSGSRVFGYGALTPATAEIKAVFVDPEFAGRGIGRRLLAHLELLARELGMKRVHLAASLNAVSFYRAAGYVEGTRGQYTTLRGLQIECVNMEKTLNDSI